MTSAFVSLLVLLLAELWIELCFFYLFIYFENLFFYYLLWLWLCLFNCFFKILSTNKLYPIFSQEQCKQPLLVFQLAGLLCWPKELFFLLFIYCFIFIIYLFCLWFVCILTLFLQDTQRQQVFPIRCGSTSWQERVHNHSLFSPLLACLLTNNFFLLFINLLFYFYYLFILFVICVYFNFVSSRYPAPTSCATIFFSSFYLLFYFYFYFYWDCKNLN